MLSSSALRVVSARSAKAGARCVTRRTRSISFINRSRVLAPPVLNVARNLLPGTLFYTTERILELKTGKRKEFQPKTVYDASHETENCGVGLVASLHSIPSRKVVEDAEEMLVRMSHRGGCGCDPASGDGAGKAKHSLHGHLLVSTLVHGELIVYHVNRYIGWYARQFHEKAGKIGFWYRIACHWGLCCRKCFLPQR